MFFAAIRSPAVTATPVTPDPALKANITGVFTVFAIILPIFTMCVLLRDWSADMNYITSVHINNNTEKKVNDPVALFDETPNFSYGVVLL